MKKQNVIGMILMALLFLGQAWYSQPTPEQLEARRRYNDSIQKVKQQQIVETAAQQELAALSAAESAALAAQEDSVRALRKIQKYGVLATLTEGESQKVVLSNEHVSIEIDSKGGVPTSVELLQYQNYLGSNVMLWDEADNHFYLTMLSSNGKYLSTSDFYFTPVQPTDSSVVMRLAVDGGCLDFVYRLAPDSYVLDFDIHYQGLDAIVSPTQPSLSIFWNQKLARQEQGRTFEES